ncbi:hypothetical protein [Nostoc sphaeroides]|uniref:Uncharacterized protein n=1 Tax=Nostoc sphaeroides CCNUC1 TaxID=2653204 RepID=A0A5P8WFF9_9NOSO|nr:hypothetical protein [Nostoc sphaeroides]QFS51565.1 hypothetical protein GXM_09059 [Nostoc sphaeroides CCNUC1]QFS52094.1 hypothetical protein GXM_09588 [Nostoc sphaeroides CCNUC1]
MIEFYLRTLAVSARTAVSRVLLGTINRSDRPLYPIFQVHLPNNDLLAHFLATPSITASLMASAQSRFFRGWQPAMPKTWLLMMGY